MTSIWTIEIVLSESWKWLNSEQHIVKNSSIFCHVLTFKGNLVTLRSDAFTVGCFPDGIRPSWVMSFSILSKYFCPIFCLWNYIQCEETICEDRNKTRRDAIWVAMRSFKGFFQFFFFLECLVHDNDTVDRITVLIQLSEVYRPEMLSTFCFPVTSIDTFQNLAHSSSLTFNCRLLLFLQIYDKFADWAVFIKSMMRILEIKL